MGYGYGESASGRMVLSCDSCGEAEGRTKKRTCPRKVLGDSTRSTTGTRYSMPYCYPPALCDACWTKHGRTKGIHADCAAGAAKSQAEYDETQRRYEAGEGVVLSASGDWAEDVPKGMVKVTFGFLTGGQRVYLMPGEDYKKGDYLSDYPRAVPMADAEPTLTKEVTIAEMGLHRYGLGAMMSS